MKPDDLKMLEFAAQQLENENGVEYRHLMESALQLIVLEFGVSMTIHSGKGLDVAECIKLRNAILALVNVHLARLHLLGFDLEMVKRDLKTLATTFGAALPGDKG